MANINFIGTVKEIKPKKNGVSNSTGESWQAQEVTFIERSGRSTNLIVLIAFNSQISDISFLQPGMKVEVNGWVETREWTYEGKAFSSTSVTPTEPVRILEYAQQPYGAQTYASQQPQANEVPATQHNDEIFNADDFTQPKPTYRDTSFNY